MGVVTMDNLPDNLTVEDLCTLLRIDTQQAWKEIRNNADILKAFKIGREYRIPREGFEIYYSLKTKN